MEQGVTRIGEEARIKVKTIWFLFLARQGGNQMEWTSLKFFMTSMATLVAPGFCQHSKKSIKVHAYFKDHSKIVVRVRESYVVAIIAL